MELNSYTETTFGEQVDNLMALKTRTDKSMSSILDNIYI